MIAWDDGRHALGVERMDGTHREFVELANRLATSGDAEFSALFAQLIEHCREHFESEGRMMRIARFPALGEHEAEHHRVYGDLKQMNRAVQRGRLMLARSYVRTGLAEWFDLHLATMDSALAAHMKKIGEAPAAPGGRLDLPVLS